MYTEVSLSEARTKRDEARKLISEGIDTVSYTHLDVYKRQFMSRTIFCTFLQREAEGQDFQLYPGELGKRIYNEISKDCLLYTS